MSPPTPSISLLWPTDDHRLAGEQRHQVNKTCAVDLDLETIVAALSFAPAYARTVRAVLTNLCHDLEVIRFRQDILQDLLEAPELARRFEELLPHITFFDYPSAATRPNQTDLHELAWRVGQLEAYVECVQSLTTAFEGPGRWVRSAGLRRLRDLVGTINHEPIFQNLVAELPDIITQIRSIASITIGVNLDEQLRPVEATLVSVNKYKFRDGMSSLLDRLFGRNNQPDALTGIAQLHSVLRSASALQSSAYGVDLSDPLLYPLFRDLAQVLKQVSRPVIAALRQYLKINTQFLNSLQAELAFYLGAVRLIRRIQAARLPLCRPELAPQESHRCELEALYNLNLALRLSGQTGARNLDQTIVTNDIHCNDRERIFILTGPNRGGKTTFTQAIGLIQILAQAGLHVPARRARLSLVDSIYTHFPGQEQPSLDTGRLGEEAQRLGEIFTHATCFSLLLLNESLSSTSFSESLYLAQDIVQVLKLLGARAIFATHLHELATRVDTINTEAEGASQVVSLVSLIEEIPDPETNGHVTIRQTYRVVVGPPLGHSYANEIASRYGISYQQLTDLLRRRGVLD